jgi:transcriptional regulator with XRE-family HTH domain
MRWLLTPGAYLKARRLVAGLTIAEVAAQLRTEPHLHEVDLIDWIRRIEADAVPASPEMLAALRALFPFHLDTLGVLAAVARGELPFSAAPTLCALCGSMSDNDALDLTWTDPVGCPACTALGPVIEQAAA